MTVAQNLPPHFYKSQTPQLFLQYRSLNIKNRFLSQIHRLSLSQNIYRRISTTSALYHHCSKIKTTVAKFSLGLVSGHVSKKQRQRLYPNCLENYRSQCRQPQILLLEHFDELILLVQSKYQCPDMNQCV